MSAILAHLDFLDEQIDRLSDAIGAQLGPFATAVELLCTIPGVQRRTAEVIIAETGGDMSAFPSARHLASWAGACPGNDESAGKRHSGRTRKGSRWLGIALTEAALAATRTKDTYLAAQYRRLRPRRGHKRALGAVKHSILVAAWHMLSRPASCTASPAATTSSAAATPTARPSASSRSCNASGTTSPWSPRPRGRPLLDGQPYFPSDRHILRRRERCRG